MNTNTINKFKYQSHLVLVLYLLSTLISIVTAVEFIPPISGNVKKQITPSDVYARALLLEKEISSIDTNERLSTYDTTPIFSASNIEPREVLFMASSVLTKAQRLSFQHTRSLGSRRPKFDKFRDKPFHVFHTLNRAMESVRHIKKIKSFTGIINEVIVTNITPTDVYNKLLSISRQLTVLSDHKIEPKDVFEKVDKSYAIAKQIYRKIHNKAFDETLVSKKPFTDKKPEDVFINLVLLLEKISLFAKSHLDIQILSNIELTANRVIEPSDVYDLANLVLAEFLYLSHSSQIILDDKAHFFSKNSLTPNDVFQRVDNIHTVLGE